MTHDNAVPASSNEPEELEEVEAVGDDRTPVLGLSAGHGLPAVRADASNCAPVSLVPPGDVIGVMRHANESSPRTVVTDDEDARSLAPPAMSSVSCVMQTSATVESGSLRRWTAVKPVSVGPVVPDGVIHFGNATCTTPAFQWVRESNELERVRPTLEKHHARNRCCRQRTKAEETAKRSCPRSCRRRGEGMGHFTLPSTPAHRASAS